MYMYSHKIVIYLGIARAGCQGNSMFNPCDHALLLQYCEYQTSNIKSNKILK